MRDLELPINSNLTSQEYTFNLNGIVHGHSVFTDGLYFMFKGGKMLNCALSQINHNLMSKV